MDKSIYSEMSNLRPKGRGRRKGRDGPGDPSTSQQANETARATARATAPVAATPPAPAIPRRAVVVNPPEPTAPLPADSHLVASLEHLRRKSTIAPNPDPVPPLAPPLPPARSRQTPPAEATRAGSTAAPSRRDRRVGRRYAKREAREDARRAKEDRAAAVAAARAERKAAATGSRRRLRRGRPTEGADPGPELNIAEPDRKERKRLRRLRITEAKEAVARQRAEGKERVAAARKQAKSSDYLAGMIEPGDWKRRELRRRLKVAKHEAKAEAASVKAEEAARVKAAREDLTAARRSTRRSARAAAHLADSRIRSIRIGLAGSWVALGAFTAVAWDAGRLADERLWMPLAAGAAGLVILSLAPWKRFAGRPITSVLVFLWLGVLMGVMIATAPYHKWTLGVFIAGVWIILYAGVLLPATGFALSSALGMAAFGTSVAIGPVTVDNVDLGLYVAGLAMTSLIVGVTVHELRTQGIDTADRLAALDAQSAALRRRESELMQLYEVSRTIGAGEDMRQVLPELVARTAGFIGAKVGLVILHRPETEELVALSPLWVAGQALEAEGYRFDVDGDSTAASVFVSGSVYVSNHVTESDIARDQLLADLGVERVAAVPLQVEGGTIGVLLVADKGTDFTEDDCAALELLSTPAGLVLNHLARYEQAQETGRRMGELAQLKSDFVSVVSHELRTPLTSVIGALSTLSRPELAPDNPVAASLLESASNQAKRLKTLIEDLLTVSKIDNEALPIRLELADVGALITRLVERVPTWADHVDLALPSRLPAIAIDPDHLERVLTNLLDNARKYAGESRIEISVRAVDDEVWISVADNGEGIPYEYEDTIFERFTQIERPDTRFKGGTGLGLNIVKDLTAAMHGRVWLEATPGGGATFILAFPRPAEDVQPGLEVGRGMLLVDPSRDRVEAPINMDDLPGGGGRPVAE